MKGKQRVLFGVRVGSREVANSMKIPASETFRADKMSERQESEENNTLNEQQLSPGAKEALKATAGVRISVRLEQSVARNLWQIVNRTESTCLGNIAKSKGHTRQEALALYFAENRDMVRTFLAAASPNGICVPEGEALHPESIRKYLEGMSQPHTHAASFAAFHDLLESVEGVNETPELKEKHHVFSELRTTLRIREQLKEHIRRLFSTQSDEQEEEIVTKLNRSNSNHSNASSQNEVDFTMNYSLVRALSVGFFGPSSLGCERAFESCGISLYNKSEGGVGSSPQSADARKLRAEGICRAWKTFIQVIMCC